MRRRVTKAVFVPDHNGFEGDPRWQRGSRPTMLEVEASEDEPLLYYEEAGSLYIVWRKDRPGFA